VWVLLLEDYWSTDFIGLEPGQASSGSPVDVPDDVIFRLAITDAVIVNAFVLIPAFLISRYKLSSEQVATIQAELAVLRDQT
jgi:Na+/melibiose symporter-like transporter